MIHFIDGDAAISANENKCKMDIIASMAPARGDAWTTASSQAFKNLLNYKIALQYYEGTRARVCMPLGVPHILSDDDGGILHFDTRLKRSNDHIIRH